MHVLMISIVRDGVDYLHRYAAQVAALRRALADLGDQSGVCICEGDSTDGTLRWLVDWANDTPGVSLFKFDHGGPKFGSVWDPVRWRNIARTYNYLLDQVSGLVMDAVLHVEADLIWTPETMLALLAHLDKPEVDAVAPMVFHKAGHFYDTHGHRMGGLNFVMHPPYHPLLHPDRYGGGLLPLETAGNCQAMLAQVARTCRFSEETCLLGGSMAAKGFRLWLDPALRVTHP